MGCGSSRSTDILSQTSTSVQRPSQRNDSVAVPSNCAVQKELEGVPECRSNDSSNSLRLDPCQTTCQTTMPSSDIDQAEGDKKSVREACELHQVHDEADLPATSEEEGREPSYTPSEGHTTSLEEEKRSVRDEMGAGKSKHGNRDVTSSRRKRRGKSGRSSSSLASDSTRHSAGLQAKNTREDKTYREDDAKFDPGMLGHRPLSGSQNGWYGNCLSQPKVDDVGGQEEEHIHEDNSDMGENRYTLNSNSELPGERLMQERQVVRGYPQREIHKTRENALSCDSANETTTTDLTGKNNETDNGPISKAKDADESSTEVPQHIEETPIQAPQCLQYKYVISPKIRQLQEMLGFVSNSPGREDAMDTKQMKPLNPFDKEAAKDTSKLGLLKCPAQGSHSSPFDMD